MPIFEYQCRECKVVFDELVSYDQSERVECPTCKSRATEKLVSAFACCTTTDSQDCGPGPFN